MTTGFPDYTRISKKELNEILSELEEEIEIMYIKRNKEGINEELKLRISIYKNEQIKAEAECKKRINDMTN